MDLVDLVAELGTQGGRPCVTFSARHDRHPDPLFIVTAAGRDAVRPAGRVVVACAWLREHRRWYLVEPDGTAWGRDTHWDMAERYWDFRPGPWLGWLLDLARENGWEP